MISSQAASIIRELNLTDNSEILDTEVKLLSHSENDEHRFAPILELRTI